MAASHIFDADLSTLFSITGLGFPCQLLARVVRWFDADTRKSMWYLKVAAELFAAPFRSGKSEVPAGDGGPWSSWTNYQLSF